MFTCTNYEHLVDFIVTIRVAWSPGRDQRGGDANATCQGLQAWPAALVIIGRT